MLICNFVWCIFFFKCMYYHVNLSLFLILFSNRPSYIYIHMHMEEKVK